MCRDCLCPCPGLGCPLKCDRLVFKKTPFDLAVFVFHKSPFLGRILEKLVLSLSLFIVPSVHARSGFPMDISLFPEQLLVLLEQARLWADC